MLGVLENSLDCLKNVHRSMSYTVVLIACSSLYLAFPEKLF